MLGNTLAGHYKIIKHLGGGGFGQTFLAQDIHLPGHPTCVVKQLKPQSKSPQTLELARRLFDTEAHVLYRLGEYEQIPRLLAHFEEDQEFFLVQQFIEGNSLVPEFQPGCRWSEENVIVLLQEVLKTLAFVHSQNVIHRDIKPANLIRRHSDRKIFLIDFGAVKQVSTQVVMPDGEPIMTVAIGTPGFMPNEQMAGVPRFSSDVYAVGMMAVCALTGLSPRQLPQDPVSGELIWHSQVSVNPELAGILDTMIRYDCRQRYPSATEALQALNRLVYPSAYNQSTATLPASGSVPSTVAEPPPPVLPQYRLEVPVSLETAGQNTTAKQTVFTEATRIASRTVRMLLLVTISIICFLGFLIGALSVAAAFTPAATSGEAGIAAAIFLVILGSLIIAGSVWVWLLAYKRLR
jgi:serine/threonine protein kinase